MKGLASCNPAMFTARDGPTVGGVVVVGVPAVVPGVPTMGSVGVIAGHYGGWGEWCLCGGGVCWRCDGRVCL